MSLQSERFHERNICLNSVLDEVAAVGIRPTCARTAMCNGCTRGATASVPRRSRHPTMMHRSTPAHGYAGNCGIDGLL
jgi:hypothetical protein